MIYAILDKDGVIINRIVSDIAPENGVLEEDIPFEIGATYKDGVYTPLPIPEPLPVVTVTPRQARLALLNAGLLDTVESVVEQTGGAVKITWEYATEINRNDPMIESISKSLNLTEEQIDDLFTAASKL